MFTRRNYLHFVAGGASLAAPGLAFGQEAFPTRPIRMVVGFPPGQSLDIGARALAAKLSEDLGQVVVIENRPGASGLMAHEAVKNSPPDGYTLQFASTASVAINPAIYRNLPYDSVRDFTPIVLVNTSPMFLVATNGVAVRTVSELVALAKSRPGQLSYGSGGSGTTAHIAMEMLKQVAGIDMLHVPYRGSPAMVTDLIAGRVQFAFDSSSSMLPHVRDGRVQPLAVSGGERSEHAPEVPTVADTFPGFLALTWAGILAPAGLPAPIVERLNAAANRALKQPDIIRHYSSLASVPVGGTPDEFRIFIASELARWDQAVRASGARVE